MTRVQIPQGASFDFFNTRVSMSALLDEEYRKGVLGVVYRYDDKKLEYLLLHRIRDWEREGWEFVKGGIKNETEKEALEREIFEETHLKPQKVFPTPFKLTYKFPLNYRKNSNRNPFYSGQSLAVYLVEVGNDPVILDFNEHDDFVWVEYEEALKLLGHSGHRWILKLSNNYIKKSILKRRNL